MCKLLSILLFTTLCQACFAFSAPILQYTLSVDTANLYSVSIEIKLINIPDTIRLAMFAHPEYDDRYWRYVEDMHAESKAGGATVYREDSALWRITTQNHEAVVKYKIRFPVTASFRNMRSAWRPFLSATGGLVGDYHCFVYVAGNTELSSLIRFQLPKGWNILTGLERTKDRFTFFAKNAKAIMDAPVLIGYFKTWQFKVKDTLHTIAYWPQPDAVYFDTLALKNNIQKMVEQVHTVFGMFPYSNYFFLLQDGSYGALEHGNSVTIGLPSKELATDIAGYMQEVAHEYFHAWNMIYIHPAEFGRVDYKQPSLARGLWWSEGATMFYADLVLRRAGNSPDTITRINHLEELIKRWYNEAGNNKISPEKVSMADNAPPGYLGDYSASTHLQGEIIANLLDLIIRDATGGKRSLDDVMRGMLHFSSDKGFTGKDVEQVVKEQCNCDVHVFFEEHIRGSQPLNFNKYLNLAALKMETFWKPAISENRNLLPDKRVYAWKDRNSNLTKLLLSDPETCWGSALLHTGDIIRKINDGPVNNTDDFYNLLANVKIGDTVKIEVERNTGVYKADVFVTGYQQTEVHIFPLRPQTIKQQKVLAGWLSGK
jgi:predicted metalloprotease with PDZ domain